MDLRRALLVLAARYRRLWQTAVAEENYDEARVAETRLETVQGLLSCLIRRENEADQHARRQAALW